MGIKTVDLTSARSVIDTIIDDDSFTLGLYTGYLDKINMVDNIYDILGLIDSNFFISLKLNDDEKRKYKYNPALLSYDLYGTPDYYATILYINRLSHPGDFNCETNILLPNKANIKTIKYLYDMLLSKTS